MQNKILDTTLEVLMSRVTLLKSKRKKRDGGGNNINENANRD